MAEKRKELLVSGAFAAFALFYFASTFSIAQYDAFGATSMNSASIPRILAVLMIVLSIVRIYQIIKPAAAPVDAAANKIESESAKEQKQQDIETAIAEAEKNEANTGIDYYSVGLTMIFLVLYMAGLDYLGFLVATFVYMLAQMLLMTKKSERKSSWIKCLVLSLIFTIAIYYLFNNIFELLLPRGLFDLDF